MGIQLDQKRKEYGSLGLCIVRAKEWLSGPLEGTRENLKSWEGNREREEESKKKIGHVSSTFRFNKHKMPHQNFVYRILQGSFYVCTYVAWEKNSVTFRNMVVIKINQINTFTLCLIIPIVYFELAIVNC